MRPELAQEGRDETKDDATARTYWLALELTLGVSGTLRAAANRYAGPQSEVSADHSPH